MAISDFDSRNRDRTSPWSCAAASSGAFSIPPTPSSASWTDLREDILAEQELSLSGMSDETVTVGEIAGARAILERRGADLLFGDRIAVEHEPQRIPQVLPRGQGRRGQNQEGGRLAPARYNLHTQRRSVFLKFEIKLISTETGEVLLSEVEQVHAQDAVEYAVSQGPQADLYPARANGEVDRSGKRRMNALLGARRDLATESALRAQVIQEATARGRRDIEQFLARHIE